MCEIDSHIDEHNGDSAAPISATLVGLKFEKCESAEDAAHKAGRGSRNRNLVGGWIKEHIGGGSRTGTAGRGPYQSNNGSSRGTNDGGRPGSDRYSAGNSIEQRVHNILLEHSTRRASLQSQQQ